MSKISRDQIESTILARQFTRLPEMIQKWLRAQDGSDEARLQAAEFYRRAYDYPAAIRVLREEIDFSKLRTKDPVQVRIQLRLARLLNLMGASHGALRLVDALPNALLAETPDDVGGILVSNYRYEQALSFYAQYESLSESELTYAARFKRVVLSDCYVGTGDYAKARAILEQTLSLSPERHIRGVIHQALGTCFLESGDLKSAGHHLETASKHFLPEDAAVDHGLLQKWLGAFFVFSGRYAQAREHLESAWKILYQPGGKPEAWLEVLFWIGLCEFRETGQVPEVWIRIAAYPMSSDRIRRRIEGVCSLPAEFSCSRERLIARAAPDHIDLRSATRHTRRGPKLGLGGSDELLAQLVLAGKWGIPQFRIYDFLWPAEVFSFAQHQKRLEQTVRRARSPGISVRWKAHHLTLEPRTKVSCLWSSLPRVRGLDFLKAHPSFFREDVRKHYRLSLRSVSSLCKEWQEQGLIVRAKAAGAPYRTDLTRCDSPLKT